MKVLYVAEPVGKAGLYVVKKLLPGLKKSLGADFVLGCGDGATGGWGLGKTHAFYLHKLGFRVITGGDCFFFKPDLQEILESNNFLLRPANYPPETPGRGWRILRTESKSVGVISLLGQSGFSKVHLDSPLRTLEEILDRHKPQADHWIVDFHGNTTAEKNSFFYAVDGLVSAVIGSHTKVQTDDPRVLPRGTGVITDAGRTGSRESVGGFDPETEIRSLSTGVPERSREAWKGLELQGVLIDLDDSGRTRNISTVIEPCEELPDDRNSDTN